MSSIRAPIDEAARAKWILDHSTKEVKGDDLLLVEKHHTKGEIAEQWDRVSPGTRKNTYGAVGTAIVRARKAQAKRAGEIRILPADAEELDLPEQPTYDQLKLAKEKLVKQRKPASIELDVKLQQFIERHGLPQMGTPAYFGGTFSKENVRESKRRAFNADRSYVDWRAIKRAAGQAKHQRKMFTPTKAVEESDGGTALYIEPRRPPGGPLPSSPNAKAVVTGAVAPPLTVRGPSNALYGSAGKNRPILPQPAPQDPLEPPRPVISSADPWQRASIARPEAALIATPQTRIVRQRNAMFDESAPQAIRSAPWPEINGRLIAHPATPRKALRSASCLQRPIAGHQTTHSSAQPRASNDASNHFWRFALTSHERQ